MNAPILTILSGVSGFIGFLSILSYLFIQNRDKKSETAVRRIADGEGVLNSEIVIDVLKQFNDDASRLKALKTFAKVDSQKATQVLSKIKDNVDIGNLITSSQGNKLKVLMVTGSFFIILALFGLVYGSYSGHIKTKPLHEIMKAELIKLVQNSNQSPISFTWRTGDPNPDCDNSCRATITPAGFSVNHSGNSTFFITRRFNAVSHCDASPLHICRPTCDGSGDVSATATVTIQPNGLIEIDQMSVNAVSCNCLYGSRGESYVRATVESLKNQTIDLSSSMSQ